MSTTNHGTADVSRHSYNLKWFTLSKALLISKEAAKTELPPLVEWSTRVKMASAQLLLRLNPNCSAFVLRDSSHNYTNTDSNNLAITGDNVIA